MPFQEDDGKPISDIGKKDGAHNEILKEFCQELRLQRSFGVCNYTRIKSCKSILKRCSSFHDFCSP